MTDQLDQAQAFEEAERAGAQAAVRCQLARGESPFKCCIDCADPIDPERRAAVPTALRCVECQEAAERLQSLLGAS